MPPRTNRASAEPAAASLIRLHTPGSDSSGDDRALTVREAFRKHVLPLLGDRAADYITDLHVTVGNWEKHSANLPIGQVDDNVFVGFRDAYFASGVSAWTVNKQIRNLTRIFRRLGPRDLSNKFGLGIIDIVPHCEFLAVDDPDKRIATDRELCDIYDACACATWPGRGAPRIWRRATVLITNFGINTGDLLRATWAHICAGNVEIAGRRLADREYLVFVREKTRAKKRWSLCLPLNEAARRHLSPHGEAGEPLIPFSKSHDIQKAQWEAIQKEAGIQPMRMASGRIKEFLTWQDLRKTANARMNRHRRGMGHHVLGHAKRDVNETYYDEFEEPIREALDTLPQPAAFLQAANQLRLF